MTKYTPKQVTYYTLDYRELERIIAEHFGIEDYSLVASEELSNDTTWTVTADPGDIDQYEREELDAWRAEPGETFMYKTRLLMNKLAEDDIIPAGDYSIDVSW